MTGHEDSEKGKKTCASIITLTVGTTETAELSAVGASRLLPQRKFLGAIFC